MTQRKYAKRKARQTYRHMDTVMANLLELGELFEKDHPDLTESLTAIAQAVHMIQITLENWYTQVWGKAPNDWYSDAP